ncbi:hypothetical protein LptCag_1316 [Leptospirillum ferriphilum]|uniref:Uncharacterized protein n=1 Tax=Leptospirillum ferriphilum TaxID=178606 RepID=A0A094X2Z9_9BACT|nr:hypothetical protein LptCag_1316 [Leptospirillum ferriphilum]
MKEHIPSDGSLKSGHLRKTISFFECFQRERGPVLTGVTG